MFATMVDAVVGQSAWSTKSGYHEPPLHPTKLELKHITDAAAAHSKTKATHVPLVGFQLNRA